MIQAINETYVFVPNGHKLVRCTSGHRTCCARSRLPVVSRVFVKLHRSWLMQGVQQKAALGARQDIFIVLGVDDAVHLLLHI